MVEGDISVRAEQIFLNMAASNDAAGASMSDIVKFTLFLTDMNDIKTLNEVYGKHFSDPFHARNTFQVSALPLTEIEH